MNLPNELWVVILKDVVDVPGYRTMHTDLPYEPSPFFEDPRTEASDDSIGASIANRLTLSYVCKLWAGILEELLFEIVMIFEAEQLRLLADALTRNPLRGMFIRRIDLRIRDTGSLGTISSETMEAILKHCINLDIFIDRNLTYLPTQYQALDLLTRHAPGLRYFNLQGYGQARQAVVDFVKYASQFTRLEILFLSDIYCRGQEAPTTMSSLSFPCLHSLTVSISHVWKSLTPSLATWNLPALTNVRVVGTANQVVDPMPFFEAHGHRFKLLVLACVPPCLERIIDICLSNLVTLIHPFDTTSAFKSATKYMPKLCLLGILPPRDWDYLIANHFEDLFDAYFGSNRT